MTLPGSGPISLSQIKAELGSSSYSLRTLSGEAGKGQPDSMSEFYGYSNVQCHIWYTQNSGDPGGPQEYFIYVGCDGYGNVLSLFPGESRGACVLDGNPPMPGDQGDNWFGPYEICGGT